MTAAKTYVGEQLDRFASNVSDHGIRTRDLLIESPTP